MSTEENKALIHRLVEEFNRGNLVILDELVVGLEPWKQALARLRAAFPDYQITSEDLIAEGDKVVERWRSRGMHRGEFMGVPPTGRQMGWTGINIFQIADGKVVDLWSTWDQLGMMQQLGVIPAPGQSPA
jgi:steroid delta-isomerase-like uncharacterized protein